MDRAATDRSGTSSRYLVQQWKRAAAALDGVRRAEVAALSDRDALTATVDLLEALDRLPPLPPRPSSGLVEQQRWFTRARLR